MGIISIRSLYSQHYQEENLRSSKTLLNLADKFGIIQNCNLIKTLGFLLKSVKMRNQLKSTHPFISVFLEKHSHLPHFNCVSTLWLISHSADTHTHLRKPPNALQLISTTCQLLLMFPPVRLRTETVPSSFICAMFIIASWLQCRRGNHFPAPLNHWIISYFGYLAPDTMAVIKVCV